MHLVIGWEYKCSLQFSPCKISIQDIDSIEDGLVFEYYIR